MKKNITKYKMLLILITFFIFSLFFIFVSEVNANTSEITIQFSDQNLYKAIIQQLNGISFNKDDANKKITLSESEISKIKILKLDNCNIQDITGIGNFTSLIELNLSNNKLTDGNSGDTGITSKLKDLKALKKLDLSHNYLKYTKGLENLINLEELNLYDNAISYLTGLNGLKKLTYLNLGDNNENNKHTIYNLQLIKNLTQLTYFDFSENHTPEIINHIYNLNNIQELYLQSNDINEIVYSDETSEYPLFSNMNNLKSLNLYNNTLTDNTKNKSSLKSLKNLQKLNTLNLGKTNIRDISFFLNDNGEIDISNINHIDISGNMYLYTLYTTEQQSNNTSRIDKNKAVINKLKVNNNIELNYEKITDTSDFPHYDSKGIAYVTYDDFGARCNGEYDDFIAIRNAHLFANENDCEVRATNGKTYHIYKYYEDPVEVKTNIDWQGATFIIHDEKIDSFSGRYKNIFKVSNIRDKITIKQSDIEMISDFEIKKGTNNIPISSYLENLNNKGYNNYLCVAENSNKKQFIRFGTNANSGDSQKDFFMIDTQGNVLNDIQWDFNEVTSFTIYAIPNSKLKIQNGNFISNNLETKNETTYTRSGAGKDIYFHRNIYIEEAANVYISNINHTLPKDEISGSYRGFLYANIGYNVNISDCKLYTRKIKSSGRSSYDLNLKAIVNCNCDNITSNNDNDEILESNRWGIVATYYCKDVLFKKCTLNRIDAHEGIYNLTVDNCIIGIHGLTMVGQGTLNVINTTISAETFINLREDYGSTWNGDVNIINCTYKYKKKNSNMPKLFYYKINTDTNGNVHDYGYDCKFPNVYIENIKFDLSEANDNFKYVVIIPNAESIGNNPTKAPNSYWPSEVVIKGYEFSNSTGNEKVNLANNENATYLSNINKSFIRAKVNKELKNIELIKSPNKTKYVAGEDGVEEFEKAGMKVIAKYSEGIALEINDYKTYYTYDGEIKPDNLLLQISYTETFNNNKIERVLDFNDITVVEKEFLILEIAKEPMRTHYISDQNFDTTGMNVRVIYNDGSSKLVTGYTVEDGSNLTVGKKEVTISYTENGVTKTTTQSINVIQKLDITFDKYSTVNYNGKQYLENIASNTILESFVNNIETNGTITVYKDNEKVTDKNIKITTGMKVKISLNNQNNEFTIVVKGDTNGDGLSDLKDLLQINKHRLNKISLNGEYLLAGDVNEDNEVDLSDLLKINKFRLGKIQEL